MKKVIIGIVLLSLWGCGNPSADKQLKVILSNGSGWSYSSTFIDIDSIQMLSKEEAFIWINGSKMKIYADLIKPVK